MRFHDECLETNIICHLQALGYFYSVRIRESLAWLKEFGTAFDSVSLLVDGRVGRHYFPRRDEFGEKGSPTG